eukprot:CAMPEP_0175717874 /NCGR_PEP_ID=MMETSP0097-20121207/43880_1 /TAXON_ID=311494 /ORGANISM="Alexandrium monilatum, Strain CCMP3105" /LENGTH=79 /DNA_ID=CAMNT_0017025453 /DNA_START=187 /DNA_END=422 /DNA_ORIENTATION=+
MSIESPGELVILNAVVVEAFGEERHKGPVLLSSSMRGRATWIATAPTGRTKRTKAAKTAADPARRVRSIGRAVVTNGSV